MNDHSVDFLGLSFFSLIFRNYCNDSVSSNHVCAQGNVYGMNECLKEIPCVKFEAANGLFKMETFTKNIENYFRHILSKVPSLILNCSVLTQFLSSRKMYIFKFKFNLYIALKWHRLLSKRIGLPLNMYGACLYKLGSP